MTAAPHLELRDVTAGYGGIPVVHAIDLVLEHGAFAVILGSNGAGKTTTLRSIMGIAQVMSGEILLDGVPLTGAATADVVASGVAMVPEGRELFSGLTVRENLETGALVGAGRRGRSERMARVFEYFPRLAERLDQTAGTLSGGEQQMVAIGRALMSGPSLLLVDEASLGLAPIMVESTFDLIARIHGDGVTVLVVEQNVAVIDRAEQVLVLEKGRVELGGRVEEIADRLEREVLSAYLGQGKG